MSLFFSRAVGSSAAQLVAERTGSRSDPLRAPVSARVARQNSVWWAAQRLRADLISTMPVNVYRKVSGVGVEMAKPPVLVTPDGSDSLWVDWMAASQRDLDSVGNTIGIIRATDGLGYPAVIELQPIEDVTVRRSKGGVVDYSIGGKAYDARDIWHERQFPVSGTPVGLSPLAAAAQSLNTTISAQRFAVEWFGNSAVPASHLRNVEKTVKATEARVVKERFKEAVSAGDVFVTGKDWEYNMLAAKENERSWVQTLEWGGAEAARFLGVPGDMIDLPTKGSSVTYANITQRNLQLFIINIGPAVMRREAAFSARLVSKPRYVKLNPGALMRMDLKGRYEAYGIAIENRFKTVTEVRALEDDLPYTPEQEAEFARLFPTSSNPARSNPGGS